MKTYELPLTRDYVRGWTPVEAIREIFQNALDHSHGTLNATIIESTFEDDDPCFDLRVDSPGASLEPRTLLLGCTSKADDPNTIGSFGEGYKIALLVLAREGIDVQIYHSGLIWTPSFTRSEIFGEDVLTIHEEKDDEWKPVSVTFVVRGLSEEIINQIKENTLQLQDHIGKFHAVSQGDVLLERQGKLYINGLFVSDTELDFGYNIKPQFLKLERDRQTVSDWDLKRLVKDMWFETELTTTIAQMIQDKVPDMRHADYNTPQLVKQACYDLFKSKHPGAIVADSQYEMDQKIKQGMTNIVVYDSTYAHIIKNDPTYQAGTVAPTIVTPAVRLSQFMRDQRSNMNRKSIVALKELIKEAQNWKI